MKIPGNITILNNNIFVVLHNVTRNTYRTCLWCKVVHICVFKKIYNAIPPEV